MKRGRFITIEGIEGVGKSTNISFLQSLLDERGVESLTTREPGGTPLGERVREILLDKKQHAMQPMAELLLMFAARSQHVNEFIEPALKAGKWVICDRFTDSSYAYQGGGRNLGMNTIAQLELLTLGDYQPDCTFILDLPVEAGLKRAENVGEKDRFESEESAFFNRVRQAFLARAHASSRSHIINAGEPLATVQSEIKQVLTPILEEFL